MATQATKPHIVKHGRLWKCSGPWKPLRWWRPDPLRLMPLVRYGVSPSHALRIWEDARG